jgi:hypothetical protein
MHKLSSFFITILVLLISFQGNSQQHKTLTIKEVSLEQLGDKVQVRFYFQAPNKRYRMKLDADDIKLVKQTGYTLYATDGALKGDVSKWLKPNQYYTFQWYLKEDYTSINGKYKVELEGESVVLKGGPSNAYYSLLLAGLGRYKMNPEKKYPVFLSVLSGALLTSGILMQINAYQNYQTYQSSTNQETMDQAFNKANTQSKWSYGLLAAGLTINLTDFLWVLNKGLKNKKYNEKYN